MHIKQKLSDDDDVMWVMMYNRDLVIINIIILSVSYSWNIKVL